MPYSARLLTFILLLVWRCAASQTPADWWFFGYGGGMQFTSNGPVAVTGSPIQTQEGCAAISDQNGNLLFYTDGSVVWNANHSMMTNGFGLLGNVSSTQSAIIVPFPGNFNKYYIFTVPAGGNSAGLRYSVVDMTQSNGLGAVDNATKNTLVITPVGEKVTSVAHANGTDYWVLCTTTNTNMIRAFRVSANGVNTTPVTSTGLVNFNLGVGYLKASPDGTKVAAGVYTGVYYAQNRGLHLWQFNDATGVLSNPIMISAGNVYGVEFSPNDSLVYAGLPDTIYQFNVSNWTQTAINNSQYTVATGPNRGWALQLGPDQKIYSAKMANSLSCINNPNIQGAGCGFTFFAINLGTGQSRIGLPTFVQSFFNPNANFDGLCFGDSTWFHFDTSIVDIDSVFWNFGDPNSGALNTSVDWFPSHVFSDTGTYDVTLVIHFDSTSVDTIDYLIQIYPRQWADLGNDTALCVGDSLEFSVDQPYASFLWSTGSTDSAIVVTDDSIIMVTTSGVCDTVSDTINIDFYYPFIVDLGPDTSLCPTDGFYLQTGLSSNSLLFDWNTGNAQSNQWVDDSGTYAVTVTNGACTYSDTVEVGYYPEVSVDLGYDSSFCYVSQATLTPTALNVESYAWSTGSTNSALNITHSGVYVLTVYGAGGNCHAIDSVRWDFWDEPVVNLGNDTSFCHNESIIIQANAQSAFPMDYRWNDNSTGPTYTTNQVGMYWVQVSDENCAMRDTVVIGQYPILEVTLGEDVHTCDGLTITLTPQATLPVNTFTWTTGETGATIDVTVHGTYGVTVSNGLCSHSDEVNAFYHSYPPVDLGPDTALCLGDSIIFHLEADQAFDYQWSNGSKEPMNEVIVNRDKSLWVAVTDRVCTTIDTILLSARALPPLELATDTSFCIGSPIMISARGDASNMHLWSHGDSTLSTRIATPGEYTIVARDLFCENQKTILIEEVTAPTFELTHPDYICIGDPVTLTAEVQDAHHYRWSDGSTGKTITVSSPGVYWIEAHHPCTVVKDTALIMDCECYARLPSAFHPDGDGLNDRFGPATDCQFEGFTFRVFNRWGELVFETSDPATTWDGTYNGQKAQTGTFAWTLQYEGILNGKTYEQEQSGRVIILR